MPQVQAFGQPVAVPLGAVSLPPHTNLPWLLLQPAFWPALHTTCVASAILASGAGQ